MITAVYLSGDNVKIISGSGSGVKAKIKSAHSHQLSRGCLVGGVITDETMLAEELREIWDRYKVPKKNVRLVVDSSQFLTRTITVHISGDRRMTAVMQQEFADSNLSSPLYDYRTLETFPHRMQRIFASAVEAEFISAYLQLFASFGVTVRMFTVSVAAVVGTLTSISILREKTCIVMLLDGVASTSLLLVNGCYRYSNRTRFFNELGSPEFISEIGRTIHGILQFHASEKIASPVTDVYLGGFPPGLVRDTLEMVDSSFHVSAALLPDSQNILFPAAGENGAALCNYICPVGAIVSGRIRKHDKKTN